MTVIAVDVDEVLCSFIPAICNYHNEKFGTSLKPSGFFSYRFSDVSHVFAFRRQDQKKKKW